MKERIKYIRKLNKDTQQDLADKIGLKQGTIAQFEKGTANPSERTINDICQIYKLNKEWLTSGKGNPFIEITQKELFKERIVKIIDKLDEEEISILQGIAEKIKGII